MMRILIVEDSFTNRYMMEQMLNEYGKCDIAVNGSEAVEAFKIALDEGKPYDLICLDIDMPSMNGHEALALIRQHEEESEIFGSDSVNVIITSALDDFANIQKAFMAQCEEYLVKPIDAVQLSAAMKRLV